MIKFTTGFEYKGVRYGWYKDELYRLPYTSEAGRLYTLLHIQRKYRTTKSTVITLFRCQRDWLTMNRVDAMTEKQTDWTVKRSLFKECVTDKIS